jgi:hypothetical protein
MCVKDTRNTYKIEARKPEGQNFGGEKKLNGFGRIRLG